MRVEHHLSEREKERKKERKEEREREMLFDERWRERECVS